MALLLQLAISKFLISAMWRAALLKRKEKKKGEYRQEYWF